MARICCLNLLEFMTQRLKALEEGVSYNGYGRKKCNLVFKTNIVMDISTSVAMKNCKSVACDKKTYLAKSIHF